MESTLKNMVLTLLAITLISSTAVGLIYNVTVGPIQAAKEAKTTTAIAQVLPTEGTPEVSSTTESVDGRDMVIYTVSQNDEVVGYAIETYSTSGFGGLITLMVGFLPDGTISKIEVLSHNETPGLGDKMERSKSSFSEQFDGKNPATFNLAVTKDGGEVDAITASTISSRAYVDAVERAYKLFETIK